jgi:hypothetical protein
VLCIINTFTIAGAVPCGMWRIRSPFPGSTRWTLEAWIAARNSPQKVVFRSRLVLMASTGMANRRIAQDLNTSRPTVILWRQRFLKGGPAALTEDAVPTENSV